MPKFQQCPICGDELETRDVAPCIECGSRQDEIQHFLDGNHTYQELEVLPGHLLVLCNFCMVDFGSYNPQYFGLPKDYKLGYEYMRVVRDVQDLAITKDACCNSCNARLEFLKFVAAVRDEHTA